MVGKNAGMIRRTASVLTALFILVACGTSDGEPSESSSTDVVDTSRSGDGSGDEEAAFELSSEPVFVNPVVDPTRFVSADIVASAGGSLVMPLSSGVEVSLSIPAGAFSRDETVSLSLVTSLEEGDEGVVGVEIEPAGTWFPIDKMPRLRFDGVSTDATIIGWDDDGVAHEAISLPDSSDSLVIAMPHFSGAAISRPGSTGKSPIDLLRNEIARDLAAEQYRQLIGDDSPEMLEELQAKWTQRFVEVDEAFVQPMLQGVATGPCTFTSNDAIAVGLGLEQMANLLGVDFELNRVAIAKVLNHDVDCARKACDEGNSRAIGKYLRAERTAYLLGIDEKVDSYDLKSFSTCGLYRATVLGRTVWNLPTGDVVESFIAKGVIDSELTEGGNLLPMTVNVGGWESLDSNGMSGFLSILSVVGGGGGDITVDCTIEPVGPSVAQVEVSFADSDPASPGSEPMVRFKPYVASGARKCVGYDVPYNAELMFATHMAMSRFIFNGLDLRHEFTASELDDHGVYRVSEKFDLSRIFPPGVGAPGTTEIRMNIQPVAHFQPTTGVDLSTEGLVDVYALLAAS
jgi:hypothetical protein